MIELPWAGPEARRRLSQIARDLDGAGPGALKDRVEALARRSREIHERECFNLNPATNVMNPRAEALLSAGLSTRPSLGHAGEKYETGLEAVEEIETIAGALAARVFGARFAEIRLPSGALANLAAFMATCRPGDAVIVPPASIGGHVTHHAAGCAGLYGLRCVEAPVDAGGYTVDVAALAALAREVRPAAITLGGSLNLFEHPVAEARQIAEEVGAALVFDAAHQCGIIAGGAWRSPLAEGAHLMTMSTYKSLGGPAGGLIVTDDAALAERLDAIAFPGLTANSDAGKAAALAVTMADWLDHGADYARAMVDLARALAAALEGEGLEVFASGRGCTRSHQFALMAPEGGQAMARRLRGAGFLACGIGLPGPEVPGDLNGLRIGTPELSRWGVGTGHAGPLAVLIARALRGPPEEVAPEVAAYRAEFGTLRFVS